MKVRVQNVADRLGWRRSGALGLKLGPVFRSVFQYRLGRRNFLLKLADRRHNPAAHLRETAIHQQYAVRTSRQRDVAARSGHQVDRPAHVNDFYFIFALSEGESKARYQEKHDARNNNSTFVSHRVLLSFDLNSGYIVSAPAQIVSEGIFRRFVKSLIMSFAPGKTCGTTPRGRTTSVTTVQG